VTGTTVRARQLPDLDAEPAEIHLTEGATVRIIDTRTDWVRIRIDEAEGWLPKDAVHTHW